MPPIQPAPDPDFDAEAAELARDVRRAQLAGGRRVCVWVTAYALKQLTLRGYRFRLVRRVHWREANPRGAYARIAIVAPPHEREGDGT